MLRGERERVETAMGGARRIYLGIRKALSVSGILKNFASNKISIRVTTFFFLLHQIFVHVVCVFLRITRYEFFFEYVRTIQRVLLLNEENFTTSFPQTEDAAFNAAIPNKETYDQIESR